MFQISTTRRWRGAMALGAAILAATALAGCNFGAGKGNAAAGGATAPAVPTVHYVNSMANAKSPDLAQHYMDFSFDYPASWKVDPESGSETSQNYIKVERQDATQTDIENFAVGDFYGTGDAATDATVLPQLISQLEGQFAAGFPGYKRVDLGPVTFAGVSGQQLRFTATQPTDKTPLQIFGRLILLPGPNGSPNGVVVLLMGTDTGQVLSSIDDLGVKGELPVIVNSFKLGK